MSDSRSNEEQSRLIERRIEQASAVKFIEDSFLEGLIDADKTNHSNSSGISFSGTDVIVVAYYTNRDTVEVFGNVQTITSSSATSMSPVLQIGFSNPVSHTKGISTFAGSIIFSVIEMDPLNFFYANDPRFDSYKGSLMHPKDLPPFNLLMIATPEHAVGSKKTDGERLHSNKSAPLSLFKIITDVRLTQNGETVSIDDLFTEQTFGYIATGYTPWMRGEITIPKLILNTNLQDKVNTINDLPEIKAQDEIASRLHENGVLYYSIAAKMANSNRAQTFTSNDVTAPDLTASLNKISEQNQKDKADADAKLESFRGIQVSDASVTAMDALNKYTLPADASNHNLGVNSVHRSADSTILNPNDRVLDVITPFNKVVSPKAKSLDKELKVIDESIVIINNSISDLTGNPNHLDANKLLNAFLNKYDRLYSEGPYAVDFSNKTNLQSAKIVKESLLKRKSDIESLIAWANQ